MTIGLDSGTARKSLGTKLLHINWGLVLIICLITAIGIALLYSAAGGNWHPWAMPQLVRFMPAFFIMLGMALVDVRVWLRFAYVIYGVILALLVVVEVKGHVGMGAQRWISLGFFDLQPSELMKLALVLVLARYFHGLSPEQVRRPVDLLLPLALIAVPVVLVLLQPNLGTALLMILASGAIFFAAGVPYWMFGLCLGGGIGAVVLGWPFLHDYQKNRVYTYLDPERDPLGHGYNIIQSKIALGSGGLFGKGFMQGSQSQLAFLPEKHTDFIFVVLAEELGMTGALILLALYVLLLVYGMVISLSTRNQFGRLVGVGLTTTFFLYMVVNVAMVTGLIPVVGIPLPLVSYGGTAMLTLLLGCGLLLSVSVHRDLRISRTGHSDY